MGIIDFLKPRARDPFELGDYLDHNHPELNGYSPKELGRVPDTRDLGLTPARIADGVAITRNGYFSAVLRVGTISFNLATSEEQEQIIAGYHAVLCQLAGLTYQIKVQVVEADLEPLAFEVDYALRGVANPQMHRLAMHYKQFLREELPRKVELMERRNYFIVSVHAPRLIQMVQAYEAETGKSCPVVAGLGWKEEITSAKRRNKNKPKLSVTDQRKEQALRHRRAQEMEAKIYAEMQTVMRKLKGEINLITSGLSANGLAVRQLNDWELTELYAGYLRPELAAQVRHTRRLRNYGTNVRPGNGWYGQEAKPQPLSQILGEQSSTVVVSNQPNSDNYYRSMSRTGVAMQAVTPLLEMSESGHKVSAESKTNSVKLPVSVSGAKTDKGANLQASSKSRPVLPPQTGAKKPVAKEGKK
jgi:hypothetical protein